MMFILGFSQRFNVLVKILVQSRRRPDWIYKLCKCALQPFIANETRKRYEIIIGEWFDVSNFDLLLVLY